MLAMLTHAPWVVQLCAGALALLASIFAVFFVPRAFGRWRTLRRILKGLPTFKARQGELPSELFSAKKDLAHLWAEFSETLFEQKRFDSHTGGEVLDAYRSTVPAEQFFNPQVVVDSRVGAEFFKHLPGILTGIGIIGTFFGLLRGLRDFKITTDASVVQNSLSVLLHSVSEAFLVSASAIFLAILITLIEKIAIAVLYRQTEEVAFMLDALYKAGAGEEMLSRLVTSSEEAVTTSKVLKDALVQDLKGILTQLTDSQIAAQRDITERQIKAQTDVNEQMSEHIGKQIAEGLRAALEEPMKAITGALQSATGDRTEAVHTLLTDVITKLNQGLKDLFGDQIAGINEMQQQTIAALQSAVGKMEQMSSSLEGAGTRATDSMATKLGEAITAMETRQELMARSMAEIVADMKASVASSQTETNAKLQETLASVGQTVEVLVGGLTQQAAAASAANTVRQSAFAAHAESSVAGMNETVSALVSEIKSLVGETRATVDALHKVTSEAISRMNSGAETMFSASTEFSKAGNAVTGALQQATGTSDKLAAAAGSVTSSTQALQGVVTDYRATRDQMASMLVELNGIVDNAKREASMTSDAIGRIEGATKALGTAQVEAEEFMNGVADVLGESSEQFQSHIGRSMDEVYRELHTKTTSVTNLLRQTIEQLATSVQLVVRNPTEA